jgi:pimeloyl-ACP methyl ester carboxylesterase
MKRSGVWTTVVTAALTFLPVVATPSTAGETAASKPYHEVEVAYDNVKGGTHLEGTLTIPDGKGPYPAVLLITGTGPQDRDETIGPLKPFAVIADALGRAGVAVLRVDDRGTGKSTGNWIMANFEGYGDDVRCGLACLKSQPEIDGGRIGLLGHSEGGIIAAMVASKSPDVAFVILLASPCIPGEEQVVKTNELMLQRAGVPAEKIAKDLEGVRTLCQIPRTTSDANELRKKLHEVVSAKPQSAQETEQEVGMYCTPWAKDYMTYDVQPLLRALKVPVLGLWGSKDGLVPPEENAAGLRTCLAATNNPETLVRILSDMNHLFQKCKTTDTAEFFQIKGCMDPEALKVITDWVNQHGGKR